MKRRYRWFPVAVAWCLGAAPCRGDAAVSFTDAFAGGPSVHWTHTEIADFSHDSATLPSTTRDYLSTTYADYASADLVFEVTVNIPDGGPAGTAFFGMGPGTSDPGNYGEPGLPHVFADIGPDGFAAGFFRTRDNEVASGLLGQGTGWSAGLHRLRMTWIADGGTALFEVDKDYDGVTFAADYGAAVDGSDNGFDAANSRLFIGGGNGLVFDDVRVTADSEPPPATHAGPVISEFLASNGDGIADEDGDRSDWLEVYNGTGAALDLGGWHLTDDALDPAQWAMPAGTMVEHGAFLLVWASGKDRAAAGEALHANFKISADGEYLALVRPDGVTVEDAWFPAGTEVPQRADVSYGDDAGWDATGFLATPTPGRLNGAAVSGFTDTPWFSEERGVRTESLRVVLAGATPGAEIRCTLDGSTPSALHGSVYTDPLHVDSTTVLRAVAVKAGFAPSPVMTHTYLYLADVVRQSPAGAVAMGWPSGSVNGQTMDYGMDPEIVSQQEAEVKTALAAIPTFSIVTDLDHLVGTAAGIYVNASRDGREWERPASIELIGADGAGAFQINGGVRIRGGYSRVGSNPKHAFRLFFRSAYGERALDYPLFGAEGTDTFRKLDLRCPQGFSWNLWGQETQRGAQNTFLRDVVSRYIQGCAGRPYTRSGFCHLYLNGQYWGLYQTQERPEAHFGASYFGGDNDEYDTVKTEQQGGKPYAFATDGTLGAFLALWTAARRDRLAPSNPDAPANYFAMQGLAPDGITPNGGPVLLDVDNLIDFMLSIFFVASYDSGITEYAAGNTGSHNWYAVRNREVGGRGWAFFLHDVESSFNVVDPGIPESRRLDRTGPFNHADQHDPTYANPAWIHQELCHNPDYRMRFADRAHRHLRPGGVMTEAAAGSLFDAWAAVAEQAILAESARWGDCRRATPYSKADWEAARDATRAFLTGREEVVLQQLRAYNDGGALPLYPTVDAPALVPPGGAVTRGSAVAVHAPGDVYYTFDGSDPRRPGGGVNPAALHVAAAGGGVLDLVVAGSAWSYLDTNADLGASDVVAGHPSYSAANWKHPNYPDAGWPLGPAPLAYGGLEGVVTATEVAPGALRVWFRHTFHVDDPAGISGLELRIRCDDGAIVYLNGAETARQNMPDGTVSADRFASSVVYGAPEAAWHLFAVDPARLVAGVNLVAVQVHQASTSSSDLGFDLALQAALPSTASIAIDHAAPVMARTLVGGEWSALTESSFTLHAGPAKGQLAVGELMYRPSDPSGHPEFIEVVNVGADTVDLAGAAFIAGLEFSFPVGTEVTPGGRVLVVSDLAAFEAVYGDALPVAGVFANGSRLSNAGERLILMAADAVTVLLDFTYAAAAPWPKEAGSEGYSLVRRDLAGDPSDPASWRLSALSGGAPGAADHVSFTGDPTGDDDLDGVANLVQHALGHAGVRRGPALKVQPGGGLLFSHSRNLSADDTALTVESSPDMGRWEAAGAILRAEMPNGDGTSTVSWWLPAGAGGRQFLRLRIALEEED